MGWLRRGGLEYNLFSGGQEWHILTPVLSAVRQAMIWVRHCKTGDHIINTCAKAIENSSFSGQSPLNKKLPQTPRRIALVTVCSSGDIDSIDIPRLQPVTPKSSLVSLKHINHILPTVYKPPVKTGMSSIAQGTIFFATGNKNKIKEVISQPTPPLGSIPDASDIPIDLQGFSIAGSRDFRSSRASPFHHSSSRPRFARAARRARRNCQGKMPISCTTGSPPCTLVCVIHVC